MRVVSWAFLTVFCFTPLLSTAEPQEIGKARIAIAKRWLGTLGVVYDGGLEPSDALNLGKAFELWQKTDEADAKKSGRALTLTSLIPSGIDRARRLTTFSAERLSTQQFVFGTVDTTPTAKADFLRNPDTALYTYSGSVTPGEFYVSVGDRTALCTAVKSIWSSEEVLRHEHDLHCDDPTYLSAARVRDVFGRIALAVNVTISAAEIPHYQSGVILSQSFGSRAWNKTVSGTFDPTLLFRSASEWQSWGEYSSSNRFSTRSFVDNREVTPEECRCISLNLI